MKDASTEKPAPWWASTLLAWVHGAAVGAVVSLALCVRFIKG